MSSVEAANGEHVRVYDPARTVVDLTRLRHRLGEPLAHGALRRYLRRRDARPACLLQLAAQLDVRGPVQRALHAALAEWHSERFTVRLYAFDDVVEVMVASAAWRRSPAAPDPAGGRAPAGAQRRGAAAATAVRRQRWPHLLPAPCSTMTLITLSRLSSVE